MLVLWEHQMGKKREGMGRETHIEAEAATVEVTVGMGNDSVWDRKE